MMQGRPAGQAPAHRRGRVRAVRAQQPLGAQDRHNIVRHAVARIGLPAGRVPQMMRHKFQGQRFGRRPGQGGAGRRQHPSLEIGEIGGERPQAVLAHPFLSEMLEGRDIVVGQYLGEAIAPVHRQDRRQGVEFERALCQRITRKGRGGLAHSRPILCRASEPRSPPLLSRNEEETLS